MEGSTLVYGLTFIISRPSPNIKVIASGYNTRYYLGKHYLVLLGDELSYCCQVILPGKVSSLSVKDNICCR